MHLAAEYWNQSTFLIYSDAIVPEPADLLHQVLHQSPAQPAAVVGDARELLRQRTVAALRRAHYFYVGVTLFLIGIVVTGFWPSYFATLLSGGVTRPFVMHLHGAVFTGWMALLLVQVSLAATGRVRLHRRVGTVGIAYGVLVLVMGIIVSFAAPAMHVRAGEWTVDAAAGFMLLPLVDMILFAGFFGVAVAYRHKPDIHKRLILAATVALAFAAVGRMNLPPLGYFLVWLSPMAAAMAFDVLTRRRVHVVNAVSTAVMAMAFPRIFVVESASWLVVARSMLQPFL